MRERDFFKQTNCTKGVQMKKLTVGLFLALMVSFALSETGQIHLIYSNGTINETESTQRFEFDIQAYMTDGSDVIGDGMVYIQYPTDMFGQHAILNNKVTVEKTGILSGMIADYGVDLYRIVNITDTYSNVFAITFCSNTNSNDFKQYFSSISTDPMLPSDLLHVTMDISTLQNGNISFPTSIPGINSLYYDFEIEPFSGGLDLTFANEAIIYNETPIIIPEDELEDPVEETVFAGNVELNRFSVTMKKSHVELTWRVSSEENLIEYIVERSQDATNYMEISRVSTMSSKNNFSNYSTSDNMVIPGMIYTYRLLAVDQNGLTKIIGTQDIKLKEKRNSILDTEEFSLTASYPNPFNPSFTVPFSIKTAQDVDIRLYNMAGEVVSVVANGYYTSGEYNIHVSGDKLASGIYLLRAQVNGQQATQKMLLVK